MQIDIKFINQFQQNIFQEQKRNICGSGGFGNGKTTVFCQKILALSCKFKNYRSAVFRTEYKKLAATTRVTFFKLCPRELYSPAEGGNRADSMGYLRLINGSEILWLHSDNTDDNILKGLEINSIFVDQAEELPESTYDIMDGRVGRWDMAEIPDDMDCSMFPQNPITKRYIAPSYMMLACNPADLSHYIYKKYHKNSEEFSSDQYDEVSGETYKYSDTHIMYEATSADNPALSAENLSILRRKGKAYREKFYLGKWGIFEGQVHDIDPLSILDNFPPSFVETLLKEARLFRVLDHGTSAPTCCLWFALYKDWLICYREYYRVDARISEHREAIATLSKDEVYSLSLCDPDITKKRADKFGNYSTIAGDYADTRLRGDPIYFTGADNNEFRTRNAIDELLAKDPDIRHPVFNRVDAPRLYFLKRSERYKQGCQHAISETRRQRREEAGMVDGETHFTDKRVGSIVDHAYDCVRYMCGYKTSFVPKTAKPKRLEGTFKGALLSHRNRRTRYGNVGRGISTF